MIEGGQPASSLPDSVRVVDLLGALSLAADLAVGLPAEHGMRACYMGLQIGAELGLGPEEQADLYYATLLMDAGCSAFTSQLAMYILGEEISARRELFFHTDTGNPLAVMGWLSRYMAVGQPLHIRAARMADFALHGKDLMREGFRNTCDAAHRLAGRLGMSSSVQNALRSVFEQWDGGGMPAGLQGEAIPIVSRIVYATSFLEVFHAIGGPAAALQLARDRRGQAFDPTVVDAFERASAQPSFWETLDQESVWETVLVLEPMSGRRSIPSARIIEVASPLADFGELKAPHTFGHGRRVAELSGRLATHLGFSAAEVTTIHTAGLLHDFGFVTVSSFALAKPEGSQSQAERETFRLHPHYAERILSRVGPFKPVAELVVAHHEAMDGTGFPRALTGSRIPVGARVIAVADRFDELTHEGPGQTSLEPEAALHQLQGEAGKSLWAQAVGALCEELPGVRSQPRAHRREWPGGLTDREVEVLRLLSRGLNRRQMAEALVVSESTVRAHLEHIYTKADVSTRTAATLFAVEHELLD